MKNILILTFLIFFQFSFCQEIKSELNTSKKKSIGTKSEINQTFFLLGTLSDYMGRFRYVKEKNQFDIYYKHESHLISFVDSISKNYFNTTFIKKDNSLYSEKLSILMNHYYDENNIIDSLFTNNTDKISYLLGVYYRNGTKLKDDIYKIQLANSPKHKNCYDFLKELGCQNIFFKRLNNIPTQYIIYFQATDELKMYIRKIQKENEKLIKEKQLMLKEMLDVSDAEFKKAIRELSTNDKLIIELMK